MSGIEDPSFAAVRAAPDGERARLAWAEGIETRDPARTTLVCLGIQLAYADGGQDTSRTRALRRWAARLERRNRARWLAEVGLLPGEGAFHLGVVEQVRLEPSRLEALPAAAERTPVRSLLVERSSDAALERLRSMPLPDLRELRLWDGWIGPAGLAALGAAPWAAELETLAIRFERLDDAVAAALAATLARTRIAHLEIDFGWIEHDALLELLASGALRRVRSLALLHDRASPEVQKAIHRPGLHDNRLRTAMMLTGGALGPRGARALAASPSLANLVSLDLCGGMIGREGAEAIAGSPHLARLEALDLGGRCVYGPELLSGIGANPIGVGGAEAIAASPTLARLRHLRLTDSGIRRDGARALVRSPYLRDLVELDLRDNGLDDVTSFAVTWRWPFALTEGKSRLEQPEERAAMGPWSGLSWQARLALCLTCLERAVAATNVPLPSLDAFWEVVWRQTVMPDDDFDSASWRTEGPGPKLARAKAEAGAHQSAARILGLVANYYREQSDAALGKLAMVLESMGVPFPDLAPFRRVLRPTGNGFARCELEGEVDVEARLLSDLAGPSVLARRSAAHALYSLRLGSERVIAALRDARRDPDAEVRALAFDALVRCLPDDARRAEVLAEGLADPSPARRLHVLELFGERALRGYRYEPAALRSVLLRALEDSDRWVRSHALSELTRSEYRTVEVEARIVEVLETDPSSRVRAVAVEALAKPLAPNARLVAALCKALARGPAFISRYAVRALEPRVREWPETVADLRRAVGDEQVRAEAFRVLVTAGHADDAMEAFGEVIAESDPIRLTERALAFVDENWRAYYNDQPILRAAIEASAVATEARARRDAAERAVAERTAAELVAPRKDPALSVLLDAVLAAPDDDAPRRAYADALTARGFPRGEFIRVQCELARAPSPQLERRARELTSSSWRRGLVGAMRRGFLESLSFWSAKDEEILASLDAVAALFRDEPISDLWFDSPLGEPVLRGLAAIPQIARVTSLGASVGGDAGGALRILLAALPELRSLSVSATAPIVDLEGVALPKLGRIELRGNRSAPRIPALERPGGFPALREIALHDAGAGLPALRAARGEVLTVFKTTSSLGDDELRALANRSLREARVHFHGSEQALVDFASVDMPDLQELSITTRANDALGPAAARAFARALFAGTAKKLTLRVGYRRGESAPELLEAVFAPLAEAYGNRLELRTVELYR